MINGHTTECGEGSPALRIHQDPSASVQRSDDVPAAGGRPERLLCVAAGTDLESRREDARLLRLIRASFAASHGIYGAPRVFLDLREAGETCSKHRVTRLMRINTIRAVRGYGPRRSSGTTPAASIPNVLQRQFTVAKPNTAWVTDITYIRTWQGWLYLAVVMDLLFRKIVGWLTKPTIARALVLDAVMMTVRRRRPPKNAHSFRPKLAVWKR